jgi:hypothetical protein
MVLLVQHKQQQTMELQGMGQQGLIMPFLAIHVCCREAQRVCMPDAGIMAGIMAATYPAAHEATAKWPATHLATVLGRVATTPHAPQLLELVVRSVSQPSEGSLLQSPHLQG